MKIGPYEISAGAFLAPMAGITNPPFRQICRELGAVFTVTELVSSHALSFLASSPKSRSKSLGITTFNLMERYPGESPFAIQIFGNDPGKMSEAARISEGEYGADVIDLNFGCPARKVVKAGFGSGVALMREPALLQEIARQVVAAINVPVTAKIRLGWSREELSAPEIARRLEDVGVQAICVHGRTREQVHSGPIDLDTLGETCSAVSIPVIGNGGIRSSNDAKAMMARTGCRRVAIGQASKGNPWIFREIVSNGAPPSLRERIRVFKRHLDFYCVWAGRDRTSREMRKHACWYFKGFSGAAQMRKRLSMAASVEVFEELLDEICEKEMAQSR
jgi:tRNA-dihydrouridine synthase B